MIKLQDFARQCGVTDRAIQKHLKTYAADLEGLYQRKGPNGTWLTDEACEILRSKMKQQPLLILDAEHNQKLKDLEDENKKLLQELAEARRLVVEAQQALLEAKEVHALLEASERRTEALEADLDATKADLDQFEPFAFGLWRRKKT